MAVQIRQASAADATRWQDLVKAALGDDHQAKQIYDPTWIASQLNPASGTETWVADSGGRLLGAISVLNPAIKNDNPVLNLGRNIFRAESFNDGSAEALLQKVSQVAEQSGRMSVARVLTSDNHQQILFENAGYSCVGFQPFKHMHRAREGVLFYVKVARANLASRVAISESLPQIGELSNVALSNLQIANASPVRDGVTGYPLKTELAFHDASFDDFELWRMQALTANPPKEISGAFNLGFGYMRIPVETPVRSILGQRDATVVAGLSYYLDDLDRCVRIIDSFSSDDISMGAMLHHVVKQAQGQLNAVYVEVDILASAPRLLKSAEQLGFVPAAYMPAFFVKEGGYTDVVKMVKLNMSYAPETNTLTAKARAVVDIIDHSLQDQKMGVAIINMLRGLPIFEGLGDGELRKIARLFTQKLYRPGEKVFNKGDLGNEAYVIMRGQIDICLEDGAKPIASVGNGQIFGELAFLDGAARVALAVAGQASILLVVQRSAFNELVQREPHLGMVVMKNVAMDLSNKLRRANSTLASMKK
jgi:hypothetical protein